VAPPRHVRFPVTALKECKVNIRQTAEVVAVVPDRRTRDKLEAGGYTFLYPLICEGDPFYLVYFLKDGIVNWIWQVDLDPAVLHPVWSFDAGKRQRKLPAAAIENLKKPELWYHPTQ
jgi:hypothetical protein